MRCVSAVVAVFACLLWLSLLLSASGLPSARRHGGSGRLAEVVAAASPSLPRSIPPPQASSSASAPVTMVAASTSVSVSTPSASGNHSLCNTCISLASFIAPLVEQRQVLTAIEYLAITYCVATKAEGECEGEKSCLELCRGIIGEWGAIIVGITLNSSLSAQAICYALDECPAPVPPSPIAGVPVPSNVSDMTGQKRWPSWTETTGTGTVLHLTDLHLDLHYSPGSLSQCELPLCCRASEGLGTNASNTAGPFGDFRCDSPARLLQSLFEYLNSSLSPRPDAILYTGDDPAHDVWAQTRASNLQSLQAVAALMQRYFPDIPVLSAVGNHETCPVNLFGGPTLDKWLYSALAQTWSAYLPRDAQQTLLYGGYYAALLRPGLYVISLNTNIYTQDDSYVAPHAPIDLNSQLNWSHSITCTTCTTPSAPLTPLTQRLTRGTHWPALTSGEPLSSSFSMVSRFNDTLWQVERLGARAIVIGHSSPSDWYPVFSSAFNAYLARYNASLLNLFFGHTHHNQVQLYHPSDSPQPHSVGYIGGSVTPYTDVNPGFAVYSYDRALSRPYLVTDIHFHWLDLVAANAQQSADWSAVRLNARSDYALDDLSPASWYALTEEMRQGGAGAVYERMQSAYQKGRYGGGQGSQGERMSFACEVENDQDQAAAACRQRMGLRRGSQAWPEAKAPHPLPNCLGDGDERQQRAPSAPSAPSRLTAHTTSAAL